MASHTTRYVDRVAEMSLSHRNHPIETFFLDRRNKAFGVGFRVRRTPGRQDHANAGLGESRRTARLHFRSRSQISTRCLANRPSSAAVTIRATWSIKSSNRLRFVVTHSHGFYSFSWTGSA